MPFRVPTMPLQANIYTYVDPGPPSPLRLTVECQLYVWKPYSLPGDGLGGVNRSHWLRGLLVPARTDVRGYEFAPDYPGDLVEIVGRENFLYRVLDVDDRWRGFENEYRIAILGRMPGWHWPLT